MTPIKRRKRKNAFIVFSHANISCHHYYVIIFWHSVMMTRKFCMRKYNKRIFAVFYTSNWCHRYTTVKTTVFYINICCFIITVLSGLLEWCQGWYHSITEPGKPLLDERISEISYTCCLFCVKFHCHGKGVSLGRIFCYHSIARPQQPPLGARILVIFPMQIEL